MISSHTGLVIRNFSSTSMVALVFCKSLSFYLPFAQQNAIAFETETTCTNGPDSMIPWANLFKLYIDCSIILSAN